MEVNIWHLLIVVIVLYYLFVRNDSEDFYPIMGCPPGMKVYKKLNNENPGTLTFPEGAVWYDFQSSTDIRGFQNPGGTHPPLNFPQKLLFQGVACVPE